MEQVICALLLKSNAIGPTYRLLKLSAPYGVLANIFTNQTNIIQHLQISQCTGPEVPGMLLLRKALYFGSSKVCVNINIPMYVLRKQYICIADVFTTSCLHLDVNWL